MFHLNPVKMTIIQKSKSIKTGENVVKKIPCYTAGDNTN